MPAPTNVLRSLIDSVKAINRKYSRPQIEMTWFVKSCLLTLRLYLIVLVGLLVYKFALAVR